MNVLGIDPGIAQTGYCLLHHHPKNQKYHFVAAGTARTKVEQEIGDRLIVIDRTLCELIDKYAVDKIIVEHVFFNRNVSSALSTAKVIGIVEMIGARNAIPVDLATPQQVKASSGMGAKADKKQVRNIMEKLIRHQFRSYHESDACAAAVYGILQGNKRDGMP